MSSIAIITARGGSKRIPRKNIRNFCGKQIMAYSIDAAYNSKLFDEVMVSTDDEEIAETARTYGAKVPFMRSAKTSNDYATTADVLREVLREYEKRDRFFAWMCCIYPTAPFVTAEKLEQSYKQFIQSNRDALIPVVRFSYPPQRCFVLRNGRLSYKWPQYINSRSQDLEPYYHDAGQYYFWRVKDFLEKERHEIEPFFLDEMEVQDIDELSDWTLAEIKFQQMKAKRSE